jgi:hypothetical protein
LPKYIHNNIHSSLFSNCFYHICNLCRIHPFIDFKTAPTIVTSIVYSKIDYCNSLYHNLHQTQINRLQLVQNALVHMLLYRGYIKAQLFIHSFITLLHPPICSSLKLTGHSFSYIAPLLWNNLPPSMRQSFKIILSNSFSKPNSTNPQPLALSRSLFHSRLKTLVLPLSPLPCPHLPP